MEHYADYYEYVEYISRIPLLTPEQEFNLGYRAYAGDRKAIYKLVEANLLLARFIAIEIAKGTDQYALVDIIQEANIGLIYAARDYDPDDGYRFTTYAGCWIKQKIFHAFPNTQRIIHVSEDVLRLTEQIDFEMKIAYEQTGAYPSARSLADDFGVSFEAVMTAVMVNSSIIAIETPVGKKHDIEPRNIIPDLNTTQFEK